MSVIMFDEISYTARRTLVLSSKPCTGIMEMRIVRPGIVCVKCHISVIILYNVLFASHLKIIVLCYANIHFINVICFYATQVSIFHI